MESKEMVIELFDDLYLRSLEFGDAQAIFHLMDSQREYMREWLPFVDTTLKLEDTIEALKHLINPRSPQFAIIEGRELIGLIGFNDRDSLSNRAEIGYWVSEKEQGRGIVIRAVSKLLEYAFMEMELNRITIRAAVENTKSRRIPERLGFIKEGVLREADLLKGVYKDICLYGLLRREYLERWASGGS